jgi:hypothetical protein
MTHTQQRLTERGINIPDSELNAIAKNCPFDTAVILAKLEESKGDNKSEYYSRKESNGDLIVLIVRSCRAITIMYRRSNQPQTPAALKVNAIVDLTKNFNSDMSKSNG